MYTAFLLCIYSPPRPHSSPPERRKNAGSSSQSLTEPVSSLRPIHGVGLELAVRVYLLLRGVVRAFTSGRVVFEHGVVI